MGYLVVCVTLLVLAHHSILAYHPFAPPPRPSLAMEPRSWLAFPILDAKRSLTLFLFATFNDIFFMSLMFFVSGLFVWGSWRRKGSRAFLRDRSIRLGLPFVFAATLLGPLAYYPSYLTIDPTPSFSGFAKAWLSLGFWPAGPVWFLWVLLAYDFAFVLLLVLVPRASDAMASTASAARDRPFAFFAVVAAASGAVYLPLAITFGGGTWAKLGPFTLQTSRVAHYLLYFLAGGAVGIHGIDRGLLAADGNLARRWSAWVLGAVVAFALAVASLAATARTNAPRYAGILFALAFVVSCAASSFATLAIFVRFVRARSRLLDLLRNDAYGIYVVHFTFVVWLQYALLPFDIPALAKATLVFVGTVALSWGATAGLRRIPLIQRVL